MRHFIFTECSNNEYDVAILVKQSAFDFNLINKHYLTNINVPKEKVIALSLAYNDKGKAPVKFIKQELETTLKACKQLKVNTLLVTDVNYFKVLAKTTKVENSYGYVLDCKIPDYEHIKLVYATNYQTLFYNPTLQTRLDLSLETLNKSYNGVLNIKPSVIKLSYYPKNEQKINHALYLLSQYPELTCDIETFDLKHYKAGIGTIGFAWNQHEGVAFQVDTEALSKNEPIRKLLKQFFESYKGKLIFHNAGFDVTVLIYQLWMNHINDMEGMYSGLETMTSNFGCTQLITYLATNSCAKNRLSLKYNAHEFAGNYAVKDIDDITKIPLDKLLEYNLIDCLSTWYVANKYYPVMVQDDQEALYKGLMKRTLITIIQMQLTGMPISMERVLEVEQELRDIIANYYKVLDNSLLIDQVVIMIKKAMLVKDFQDRKNKAKNPDKIKPKIMDQIKMEFNPNSSKHIATLLHDLLDLPVLNKTPTGQPATDEDTLTALINHTDNSEYQELIKSILGISKVNKILNTFIPAFKEAVPCPEGNYYLFGSFNLGGTISGRLSSSNPNLQQIPSGSTYGKLIKSCFMAPKGWIFSGADFASLEDRINTLLTKDPNKVKVYTDGYDGHSLRAYSYFGESMPDIDPNSVDSINSIGKFYKPLRQDSKAPTFLLTYGGSFLGLMKNCGFSEEQAKDIEAKYHQLYQVSDEWVYNKLKQASHDGYVTLAFGLRLRTPILKQVLWDTPQMPREAAQEGRSAGNAVSGQSYGLLNCRAANELRERLMDSPYKYDIKICAQIHDAVYFLVRDNVDAVHWLNINLIECMEWQDLEEIQHDEVKLGAELDLFYPSWAEELTLPNKATKEDIINLCKE